MQGEWLRLWLCGAFVVSPAVQCMRGKGCDSGEWGHHAQTPSKHFNLYIWVRLQEPKQKQLLDCHLRRETKLTPSVDAFYGQGRRAPFVWEMHGCLANSLQTQGARRTRHTRHRHHASIQMALVATYYRYAMGLGRAPHRGSAGMVAFFKASFMVLGNGCAIQDLVPTLTDITDLRLRRTSTMASALPNGN
jgi:hypothetical protein